MDLSTIVKEVGTQLNDARVSVNDARDEYNNNYLDDGGWQNWLDSCTPEALQIDASQCFM